MSTLGQVVDRVYREWLRPPSQQPAQARLSGALDASSTSVALTLDTLAPEEQDILSPGIAIEVERELMLLTAYQSGTATVIRGHMGTTAATHAISTPVLLAPSFSRQTVVDAVADEVVALHPTLWGQTTVTLTGSIIPLDAPADATGVASVLWVGTASQSHYARGSLIRNYPPSATGRAIKLDVPEGRTAYVTYKHEFTRPTAESDDLSVDFRVETQWEDIIVIGAAARLVGHVDPTRLRIDWASNAEQTSAVPVGTGSSLQRRLMSMRNELLTNAAHRLRREYPPVTTWTDPFAPSARV